MEEDQSQSQPQASNGDGQPAMGLQDYQFTFGCSAPNSANGSFLEPDAGSMMDESMSLTESIFDFPKRFGRTYHAYRSGSYNFPNDKLEQDRLAIQDIAFTKAMGDRLYFAPLDDRPPRRILDIATGTGDWAIAMGDRFPEARVTATDLSPIQPDIVPINVEFFVEDSSEPWIFNEPFDYIHTKTTGGCWESFETQIVQQAFDTLAPGGWFEAQECAPVPHCDDGTLKPDSAMALWFVDFLNAAVEAKRPHAEFGYLKSMMERVGFVDVHQRIFKAPLNGWAKDPALKEIGQLMETNMQMGLSAFSLGLFTKVYGRTQSSASRYRLSRSGERFRILRFMHTCRFSSYGGGSRFRGSNLDNDVIWIVHAISVDPSFVSFFDQDKSPRLFWQEYHGVWNRAMSPIQRNRLRFGF